MELARCSGEYGSKCESFTFVDNINQNEVQSYPGNGNIGLDTGMVLPQRQQPVGNFGREGEAVEVNPWAGKNVETRIFKQNYGTLRIKKV